MPGFGYLLLLFAAAAGVYLYAIWPRTTRISDVMQYNHAMFAIGDIIIKKN